MVKNGLAYKHLLAMLTLGEPFTFARFNDGEMGAITGTMKSIARKDQQVTSALREDLIKALTYRDPARYWIGGPCGVCYPQLRNAFNKRVGDYYNVASATLFCNGGRWTRFLRDSFRALNGKSVVCFAGKSQRIAMLMNMAGVKDCKVVPVKEVDSYSQLDHLLVHARMVKPEQVVLLTCGPVSRILAHQGCLSQPEATWLDLGSTYDPLTRGVWHDCHLGKLSHCKGCNNR